MALKGNVVRMWDTRPMQQNRSGHELTTARGTGGAQNAFRHTGAPHAPNPALDPGGALLCPIWQGKLGMLDKFPEQRHVAPQICCATH